MIRLALALTRRTLLAAFPALLLCPSGVAAGRRLRVGFVNPGRQTDMFWRMAGGVMQVAAAQLDIDLDMRWGERERSLIIAQGEALAAARPDFLLLVNEHRTALPILHACMAAQVPALVAFSGMAPEDTALFGVPRHKHPLFLGSLVADNHGAGRSMGEVLIDACRRLPGGHGVPVPLIALGGMVATPAGKERSDGLVQAVADAGAHLLDHVQVNWSRDEAYDRALSLLRRQPRTLGIWCANDDMALGAMAAATHLGRQPGQDLHLVGMNWQDEALAHVAAGRLLLSMGGHFLLGAWALAWLRDYADGVDFAANGGVEQSLSLAGLGAEQVAPYLSRVGQDGWRQLDFTQFRRAGAHHPLSVASLLTGLGLPR